MSFQHSIGTTHRVQADRRAARVVLLHSLARRSRHPHGADILPAIRAEVAPGWSRRAPRQPVLDRVLYGRRPGDSWIDDPALPRVVAELVTATRVGRKIRAGLIRPQDIHPELTGPHAMDCAVGVVRASVELALWALIHEPGAVACALCVVDAPGVLAIRPAAPGDHELICRPHRYGSDADRSEWTVTA